MIGADACSVVWNFWKSESVLLGIKEHPGKWWECGSLDRPPDVTEGFGLAFGR